MYYLCAGQSDAMTEDDYRNEYLLLEQDQHGNVSFDVLMQYLTSNYELTEKAAMQLLKRSDFRKQQILTFRQFINLIRKLKGIKTSVAKKSYEISDLYNLDNNGYINKYELLEDNWICSLRVPLGRLLI